MREDLLIQRLREAIRKRGALSPQERFDEMVRRGVIDEKGNVLLRAPEPPKRKKKKRRS
jgi:hypothetical protein